MNSLVTALADFALAASCLIFSWKLWSQHAPRKSLNNSFFGLFLATAVAALAGGLRHSKPWSAGSPTLLILNASILLLAGVAAYNVWLIDVQVLFGSERALRVMRWVFRILFVLYLIFIWHHGRTFEVAIAAYFPPAVILFVVATLRAMRARNRFYFFGVVGLLLCFAAAWVEVRPIDLHVAYLNRDVLYDILDGLGLWGVYLFGSRISRLKSI